VSDLQALLGTQGTSQPAQDQGGDQGGEDQQKKKRRPTPKPERVKAREKATGIDAVWDENDNGGRGGWVIPGISSKMGGPGKDSKVGQGAYSDQDVQNMKGAAPTLENAMQDFLRGGYQDSLDKLDALVKADPTVKDDPKYRRLRKHVEIELNIS